MGDSKLETSIIMIVIFVVLIFVAKIINASGWNDGYCSCGGRWKYMQAIGHKYQTNYLYECDKCGKTREFFEKYEEVEE